MAKRSPNYGLTIALILAATAITYWAQARTPVALTSADIHSLPPTIGSWVRQGRDGKISKEALVGWNVSERDFLNRTYAGQDGKALELMVVYKGLDRRGWHLSEMCFSGAGSDVTQTKTLVPYAGKSVSAVKLVAEDANTGSKVVSVYLFACGKHTESDFAKQQGLMLLSRLRPPKHGWAFVRVTGQVTDSDEETLASIREFLRDASGPLVKALTCPRK